MLLAFSPSRTNALLLEFCPQFAEVRFLTHIPPSQGTPSLPGWDHSCGSENPSGNDFWDTPTNPAVEGEGRKE